MKKTLKQQLEAEYARGWNECFNYCETRYREERKIDIKLQKIQFEMGYKKGLKDGKVKTDGKLRKI